MEKCQPEREPSASDCSVSRLSLTKSDLLRDAVVSFLNLRGQRADVLARRNLVESLIKISGWLWLYEP